MKYLILILTAIFLYSCASPITSMDQVEIYNIDLLFRMEDGEYRGFPFSEEEIFNLGTKKEVEIDTFTNVQTVRYINEETGYTSKEIKFFRNERVSKTLVLELGEFTNIQRGLSKYVDSIYRFRYNKNGEKAFLLKAKPKKHALSRKEELAWIHDSAEFLIKDMKKEDKDSIYNVSNSSECDTRNVTMEIFKRSAKRGKYRMIEVGIFLDDEGQITQMCCSKNEDMVDLKLIMDTLMEFNFKNFVYCSTASESGMVLLLGLDLGGNFNIGPRK